MRTIKNAHVFSRPSRNNRYSVQRGFGWGVLLVWTPGRATLLSVRTIRHG